MVASLATAWPINRCILNNSNAHLIANLQRAVKPANMLLCRCDESADVKCHRCVLASASHPRNMSTKNTKLADSGCAHLLAVKLDMKYRHKRLVA